LPGGWSVLDTSRCRELQARSNTSITSYERSREVTSVKQATFGAGCFWGIEAEFRQIPGVIDTAVGYSGGNRANPTYEDVCNGRTGHAEVVQVTYDPAKVAYEQLLEAFWTSHDPTQLNRQGPDIGDQYRSVIFFHDDDQKIEAEESKRLFEKVGRFRRPIVTQIVPAMPFYRAEEYHQQYLQKCGVESRSGEF
jgi:peptide-methionine (S)-S-oxide reductase